MYVWTKRAFGDRHAFLCGWLYFISNILYFPSLLFAGIGMSAYALGGLGRNLAENRAFALPATLFVLWAVLAANFFGMRVAKWISTLGGSSTFIIGALLVVLGVAVMARTPHTAQNHIELKASFDTLNFWSQIAFAFVGLELAPIVSGEIRNPARDLPRAALISGIISVIFYVGVTAALLILLPLQDISPMIGLVQAARAGANWLGLPALSIAFALLIGFALLGQLDTWVAGNTRVPYVIGLDSYLPAAFKRIHPRWGTPYVSLFAQAAIATAFLLMAQLGETARAAYQIMVDMMVIATFLPFVYIFASGYRFASRIAAIFGMMVTVIAIVLSAIPPPEVASIPVFEMKVIGGSLLVTLLGLLVFRRYRRARV